MTGTEFLLGLLIVIGLGLLRFGIPLLVMSLFKLGCCRILHLKAQ